MQLVKKTMTHILHVLIVLFTALLIALGIYFIFDLEFSSSLLGLGLITLVLGYLEFIKKHRGIQVPIFLGRSPVNSNTTAVLNTEVQADLREANQHLDQRRVKRNGEGLITLFSHTALEYLVAGAIIAFVAFSIYVSASIDYGMTEAMGDNNGFVVEEFPWQMNIDRFYEATGYTEEDATISVDGIKEIKREGLDPLIYSNAQFDLIARFEDEELSKVSYRLINQESDVILSVSNQLYKSFEKRLSEPKEGSLDMLLELPKRKNDSRSVTWQGIDGSRLTVSIEMVRPNYVLEVTASAPYEPIVINTKEKAYFIEDYENETWYNNEQLVNSINHIFLLKERYYNQEFNYAKLTEGLGQYFDLPKTFIKPDDLYGFIDPTDSSSSISNKDTSTMDEVEFNELLERLTLCVRPYDILQFQELGSDVDISVESKNRRYYMSSIIDEDENSSIIYVKELNRYDETALDGLEFDTKITDYWFLFKKDIGKIYAFKEWGATGNFDQIDLNKINIGSKELKIEMFDITDSILSYFD